MPESSTNNQGKTLVLKAPLSGVVLPLEQVPDPVFAQKMVGDGVAIDPTSNVLQAPCDGEIIQVHDAKHAYQIKSDAGPEVLIHIGLDTVMLRGEGFAPAVKEGERVTCGQTLVTFDADLVASKARSLMTEIVITNYEDFGAIKTLASNVEVSTDDLLTISLTASASAEKVNNEGAAWLISDTITLLNPQGIHARPAAVLSKVAKQFSADVEIRLGGNASNACSIVGLMGLNTKNGDQIVVAARGGDAEAAITAVKTEIEAGLGEDVTAAPTAGLSKEISEEFVEAPLLNLFGDAKADIQGIAAAPGTAVANVFVLAEETFEFDEAGKGTDAELSRLDDALAKVEASINELVNGDGGKEQAEIFAAHLEMLSDPGLKQEALDIISQGKSAEFGWDQACKVQIDTLTKLNNPLLAQRASDLQDLRVRMLSTLLNKVVGLDSVPQGAILAVDDLTPSVMANLSADKVSGIVTRVGGATSHAAILARAAGMPYVAGIKADFDKLTPNLRIMVDGKTGEITIEPSEEALAQAEQAKQKAKERRERALAAKDDHATMADGKQIEVVANIANEKDALNSVELGGEGVGLLRSEFLFQDRTTSPDEDEQFETYSAIQKALAGRPLIIRTLDVGGDKPLAYLPLPEEENPFLGERGIRVGLNRPGILRPQVRAILRANAQADEKGYGKVRIMFPMISIVEEVRVAKQVVQEEAESLGVPLCEIGIMVEVPSTAAMASQFAKEVDFFSIGSNDLSQYTMAIDRGHPKLAAQADCLNPGILQLIKMTVEGAHKHGKWVGVCGGVASEPEAVPILLGLGVDELSVSVPQIPEVKAQVRNLNLEQCRAIAEQALELDSAIEARALTQSLSEY